MNRTLMSSLYPAPEQSRHSIHQWQKIVPDIAVLANYCVQITIGTQPPVPAPTISANHAPGLYTISHGACKAQRRCIDHSTKAYPSESLPLIFNRYDNQSLATGSSPCLARSLPAHIGLIYLHGSSQPITPGPYHGSAQLMKPSPSGSIAPKSQNPLKTQSTDSVLLTDYIPHSPEPEPQRLGRVLKDGSSNNRCLEVAKPTSIKRSTRRPRLVMAASRTAKSIWPPEIKQVLLAGFFVGKSLLEFKKGPRVVFHNPILYLVVTRVKCIAQFLEMNGPPSIPPRVGSSKGNGRTRSTFKRFRSKAFSSVPAGSVVAIFLH